MSPSSIPPSQASASRASPARTPLSWALAVSTCNRGDALLECIRLALLQSRPPVGIVVVDASDDWAVNRDRVVDLAGPSGVPLHYRRAAIKSLTMQRNQAMELVRADVVFLIDDDSFMYDDCAAEILAVYEKDEAGAIAAVGACGVEASPTARSRDFSLKVTGHARGGFGAAIARSAAGRFVYRHVLMMGYEQTFVPYDTLGFPPLALPATVSPDDAVPVRSISGYALTVRVDIARREPFDPSLRHYAALEDADFCHRIARHGALVLARRARLHHFQISGGRLPRETVITLQLLNLAFFLKRHSRMLPAKRMQYRLMLLRRLVAEFAKDLLSRRFALPQFRGVLRAMALHRTIFSTPTDEIVARYPEIQLRIIERG